MPLHNKTIFILGTSKFDGEDRSTSYNIALELARTNQVYYIDYPLTWKDVLKFAGTDQWRRRRPHFHPQAEGLIATDLPGLKIIICPPLMSINFLPEGRMYRKLLKINESIIRNRIKRVIQRENIADYIYFNSFNFHYPGIGDKLSPSLRVYQCVDPMIIPYDMKHGRISEEELVRKSDLVICTSRSLCKEKKTQNPNTYFIPNAADIDHSSGALNKDLGVHPALENIPGPIIGYIGSIERRIDYAMVKELLASHPDKSFVFAGPVSSEYVPDWFKQGANLYLPGRIAYADIPSFLKGISVAIIPFKKDQVSNTIFPLKLFEYLGAGKPVIATDFNPDLEELTEDTVHFCGSASSFSTAIREALSGESEELVRMRVAAAANNTWKKRTEELGELIISHLQS